MQFRHTVTIYSISEYRRLINRYTILKITKHNRVPKTGCIHLEVTHCRTLITISLGYDFSTDEKKKASYYYVLQQLNKMGDKGCHDFPFETWLSRYFILPFCLSAEESIPKTEDTVKIENKPISPTNDYTLYLKFKNPTTR